MIYTEEQIDNEVSRCGGTWVKRRNTKNRLIDESNESLNTVIDELDNEIRKLKVNSGLKEQELRLFYSFKSKLVRRLL